MLVKVDFYNMLSDTEAAYKLIKSNKFRYFYQVFTEISYQHPKALFLRTLIEYSESKIKKEEAIDVIVETVKFMMKFLTIGNRDSKDAITLFARIMNDAYLRGNVDKDVVLTEITAELIKQGVSDDSLKSGLSTIDAFEQNRSLSKSLLALYEASSKEGDKVRISYDQAYAILKSFSQSFSLDHLLVQTPDKDSSVFKYYKNDEDTLVLKGGNDFPKNLVANGMRYDLFTQQILNKIGNIRIYYRDKNSGRRNSEISLKEYPNFYTYKDIVSRGDDLVGVIIDECLKSPSVDFSKPQSAPYNKAGIDLPNMGKLIEFGLVSPGDRLYITVKPDESTATLIDDKYVNYKGNKVTLNEWGCKVTEWKSIRIYAYAAIVGETETLHQKRLTYLRERE